MRCLFKSAYWPPVIQIIWKIVYRKTFTKQIEYRIAILIQDLS